MAYQTGKNIQVSFKKQTNLGTIAPGGAGATGLRISPSAGLRLQKATINSNEVRRDGQTTRGRHGTRTVPASTYETELPVGALDAILEMAMRSTWTAAQVIDETDVTSITTTTDTIVAASGSWLLLGIRRGDVIRLANHAETANNNKWFRVLGVTATTLTLPADSLVADGDADFEFELTVAKTLVNGPTPIESYITIDEYNIDTDVSYVATDCKISQIQITANPDANIVVSITVLGLDLQARATGDSPYFTDPVYTTALPLVMADGIIRINGVDYGDLTAFQFTWNLGGQAPSVLGPNAVDVFLANAVLTGSLTAMRNGALFFNAFRDETQIEFFVFCEEAEGVAEPRPFISFYLGNGVFDGNDGPIGGEGPLLETIPFRGGKDEAGGDRALTTMKISTSAA
jgi:hypothetical protein